MSEQRINFSLEQEAAPAVAVRSPEPSSEEQKINYASIAERFVALLIDYGIIFIPLQTVSVPLVKWLQPEWDVWQFVAMFLSFHLVFILYETIFSCGDRVTLGKSLVGIAVMKQDGSGPISFPRAFLRSVGYYISAALFMGGFFLAFIDDQHRSLHDRFGGSIVVELRPKSTGEKIILRLAGSLLLMAFGWVAYSQILGGGAMMDQIYISQAKSHVRKLAQLEEEHNVRYGYYTKDIARLFLLSGDPVQFQRDTQKALERKGFGIGVTDNSYKIAAHAKDKAHTLVVFEP